jgi:flagellar biogenesis protein FliO
MFLIAAPLCAQVPPLPAPPRPNTNSTQLENLRDRFASSATTNPQVGFTESPAQPIRTAHPDVHFPEELPPPRSISQASFMSQPITHQVVSEEPSREELPNNSYYGFLDEDEVYDPMDDRHHVMLDRPLSRRSAEFGDDDTEPDTGGWRDKLAKPDLAPLISVGGTLLIVIAAFFILAMFLRKVSPPSNRPLPKDAFECLGRHYLTQKHQLQLLRVGSRIVLVSVMPDGVSTLVEITDPDEAVSLLGLCRRLDSNSSSEMFRKTVASMSEEELSQPYQRPVVSPQRRQVASFDVYSEPEESLAAILARGRQHGR